MNKILVLLFVFISFSVFSQDSRKINKELNKATKYFTQQKYKKAIKSYSKVIELDKGNRPATIARGYSNYILKNYKAALVDFHTSEAHGGDTSLFITMADSYGALKKHTEAISYFQKAFALGYQGNATTYFGYGTCYFWNGEKDSARVYLEKSYELDSTNHLIYNNLAWTYLETEPKKSCKFFKKAYDLDSLDGFNINNLGYAYLVSGKPEKAFYYFKKAKKANPKNSFVDRNFGLYYKAKGDKKNAKKYLNKALKGGFIEEWGREYITELQEYCDSAD